LGRERCRVLVGVVRYDETLFSFVFGKMLFFGYPFLVTFSLTSKLLSNLLPPFFLIPSLGISAGRCDSSALRSKSWPATACFCRRDVTRFSVFPGQCTTSLSLYTKTCPTLIVLFSFLCPKEGLRWGSFPAAILFPYSLKDFSTRAPLSRLVTCLSRFKSAI